MNILDDITPLERVSTNRADEIVRNFEAFVVRSKLQAGTCLGTKEDLRRRFKVSPGTMNEAARMLVSRGVINLRRGVNGGVFVAATSPPFTIGQCLLEINGGAASVENCWAVLMQLKPLLIVEATRRVTDDAVTELHRSLDRMAATSADQPLSSIRWNLCVYKKIVEMGSNAVLKIVCTTLLNFLEHREEELAAISSSPDQLVAIRREVEAIASGKSKPGASDAVRSLGG